MHTKQWMGLGAACLLGLMPLPALAKPSQVQPGMPTEMSLALQRDGGSASPVPQAASPEQREKAAERFLKTYERAIPENYYGTTFGAKK